MLLNIVLGYIPKSLNPWMHDLKILSYLGVNYISSRLMVSLLLISIKRIYVHGHCHVVSKDPFQKPMAPISL